VLTIFIGARIGGHGAKCAFAHPTRRRLPAGRRSLQLVLLPLLAFAKALRDRRSPEDQRGLVREALREVGVIVLHDVEHGFLGKPSMVISKEFMQVSELFVVHGFRASVAIPQIYRKLLILCQLLTRLVTLRERIRMVITAPRRTDIGRPRSVR
jgi:hypothetical protein